MSSQQERPSKVRRCLGELRALVLMLALGTRLAACGSEADLPVDPEPPDLPDPPAAIEVSPAEVGLHRGETQLLTAVVRTAGGTVLPGRPVTWSSADRSVATVSAAGLVQAIESGTTSVTAADHDIKTSVGVTVSQSSFYVAPNGAPNASGALQQPWDLATALGHPAAIHPGDTIWIREGVYRGCFQSQLRGRPDRPIVLRQFPGERAILDGAGCDNAPLTVRGGYAWYWGFEVRGAAPSGASALNLDIFGEEVKAINLVVHDSPTSGIGFWSDGAGGEIYGCLIYNNGTRDNLDHGIYTQNARGIKRIADNIVFNQWGFGLHAFGSAAAPLVGFEIEGNAFFNNGSISPSGNAPNVLVGGSSPAANIVLRDNVAYSISGSTNVRLGWDVPNVDLGMSGSLLVGGGPVLSVLDWARADIRDNTLVGEEELLNLSGGTGEHSWSGNVYYRDPAAEAWGFNEGLLTFQQWQTSAGIASTDRAEATAPSQLVIVVRPNRYEPGRGHIIVYDPSGISPVSVDASRILTPGLRYEVRNAQTYFAAPVLSGTYDGSPLILPMDPITPTAPEGRSYREPPRTGPFFNVFVVLPVE